MGFGEPSRDLWGSGQRCSVSPSPGAAGGARAPSGPALGTKGLQALAVGICATWLAVTRSDPCPMTGSEPVSLPPPRFMDPAHCIPRATICVSRFLTPNRSFPAAAGAGAVGFWLSGDSATALAGSQVGFGQDGGCGGGWAGLRCPTLAGASRTLPTELGKETAGGSGLGATIPMGFKRPRGAAGTQDGLFRLTMRTLVLLAALVAAAAGTETFVGYGGSAGDGVAGMGMVALVGTPKVGQTPPG